MAAHQYGEELGLKRYCVPLESSTEELEMSSRTVAWHRNPQQQVKRLRPPYRVVAACRNSHKRIAG